MMAPDSSHQGAVYSEAIPTALVDTKGTLAVSGQEFSSSSVDLEAALRTPESCNLAAIPEACDGSSVSYRSKRRAGSMDEDTQARAARLKASRNLDGEFSGGNADNSSSFLSFSDDIIISRLRSLGFSLGDNAKALRLVQRLKSVEHFNSAAVLLDTQASCLEEADLHARDEEEIDRFILSNLCGDLMEEVMDADSEHIVRAFTDSSSTRKKGARSGNKHQNSSI
jgi:hypothetical protein